MALEVIKKEIDNAIKKLNELDTKITLYSNLHEKSEDAYSRGLRNAWELAMKIFEMPPQMRKEIFGEGFFKELLHYYTPQKLLEKLKIYEEEQKKIKIGDIVNCNLDKENDLDAYGVVTGIYECQTKDCPAKFHYEVLMHNGDGMTYYDDEITKTDKHIDIQSILAQIGVDKDEEKVQD